MGRFCADSEGNVPLWDAILGNHEPVIRVLIDNGATLSMGDIGQFACYAAEQNNLDLLKEIIKYDGDVTLLSSLGTTAMHTAISEENVEIVKFLIEQGADIDKPDAHGWTPRALAEYLRNEEITAIFQTVKMFENQNKASTEVQGAPYLQKYLSESSLAPVSKVLSRKDPTTTNTCMRGRAPTFQNSLAGIITAGQKQNEGEQASYR